MQDSPNVAKFQIIQIKWKSCHKNTERECSGRNGEDWCSYLCHDTEILSQCWPPTASCSKEGTFAQHCLQIYVLLQPDSLEQSPEAHQQCAPSCFWVWNEHRSSPGIPSHMTQLISNLYNLPRKDSDLTAMCFRRCCTCKHNLYVLYSPPRPEVWSAIETNEQRNDLVMHSLDNLNRQASVINGLFWPFCTMYSHFKGKHTEIA